MLKPLLPDKEYFRISEAARIAQVPQYTLRHWEERFSMLRPVRRESGHRSYTRRDLETILRIKELLHEERLTVPGARKALLEEFRKGGPSRKGNGAPRDRALVKLLREVRTELEAVLLELGKE